MVVVVVVVVVVAMIMIEAQRGLGPRVLGGGFRV